MNTNRFARVSRRVSHIAIKHSTGRTLSKTIQRGTVKYVPFIYESIHCGHMDIKSFENATLEVIMCDVLTVGLNISIVLWNTEMKNMSKNILNEFGPQDNEE